MEKPFLTLGPKEFLSGIAPSAHVPSSGLFYAASGVTPLYDAAGSASVENGLLQAGSTPTDLTDVVVVDSIIGSCVGTDVALNSYLYMIGSLGNFYQQGIGASAPTNLRNGSQFSNPTNAMEVWGPAGGTTYLWYWNNGSIGKWDLSGVYPTGWTDAAYTGQSNQHVPTHKFAGNVYDGGQNGKIGALLDDGAGGVTRSTNVLDFTKDTYCTGLSDDGTYLVLSTISNYRAANMFAVNKIYFWDTFSASWTREFEIIDPFIWALKNIGGVVYAFGQYGIWEVTLLGVKKIFNRAIDSITTGKYLNGQLKKALVYNGSALMFASPTTSTIDTFGKMSPDVPAAHLKPFKVPSGTITHITASLEAGRVYVATDTPKLYAYDFNAATHDSGNTAQTIYFNLPSRMNVKRIDVVFGEPLASGDAFSIGVYSDQDTAVTDFGSVSYDGTQTTRRKSFFGAAVCDDQLSLLLTFTSGAVKVKRVDVYGDPMAP